MPIPVNKFEDSLWMSAVLMRPPRVDADGLLLMAARVTLIGFSSLAVSMMRKSNSFIKKFKMVLNIQSQMKLYA